ncbi:MAG: cyclic nucleotide-binding domain-containing protein, partial [Desulfurivibrionaceae bacterium]|nr:cyclic nucleotide-binding domain-containing protein [Desulfurivibrionaceae bacterium]
MMEIFDHPELRKYVRSCPAGFIILTEGDQADALYILIEGSLDVIKGGKKIHEINRAGAFFGELSFLLGTVRIASVISATEDTRFLCLPNSEVERIWRQFPEFARHLARNLASRLHETTNVAQGFREFCDRMPDAVIMTNAKHTVLSWNRAAEKLYGRSWHQMSGNSIEEIYDNQAAFKQFMAELEAKGAIREKTLKINHPEKEWFFVSTSTTMLKDPHDNIQGYLFLGRDVTSVRKLEKKQRLVMKWLLPLLIGLALLTGWLCWRQLTISPRIPPRFTGQLLHDQPVLNRLSRDTNALELALHPALVAASLDDARRVLIDYFTLFRPEFYGVAGVLIIDGDQRIFCGYLPSRPENTGPAGQSYQGVEFSKNTPPDDRSPRIFMVARPESAGGEGVEL